jgi:RNA polymerase sigma-70 factor (ECF subfamily)
MLFKNKDELAYLFNTEYDNILLVALRILNNNQEAEDVVQDCFIKLWENRGEISIDGSKSSYLKKMVRNRCIDIIRAQKESVELNEDTTLLNEEEEPDDDASKIELVNKTINNLPEKCRQIFVLSKFEKMTYQEISKKLEISPKTVENQISIALKKIRKSFLNIIIPFL